MTKKARPPTAEGLELFLDYWLYGVLETAREFGNASVFLRQIQQKSLQAFRAEVPQTELSKDPVAACIAYTTMLDDLGVYDAKDATFRANGDGVTGKIGESCLYRRTCTRVHAQGKPVVCFRATALAQVLRGSTGHDYDPELREFGVPCEVTLKRVPLEDVDAD